MNKFNLNRNKYKIYNKLRKNPEKNIPLNMFYCYGSKNTFNSLSKYSTCNFLRNKNLDSHLKKFRKIKIDTEYCFEEMSAKCSLTGHWIFDYCKHCDIKTNTEEI